MSSNHYLLESLRLEKREEQRGAAFWADVDILAAPYQAHTAVLRWRLLPDLPRTALSN